MIVDVVPDPKAAPRIVDPDALAVARASGEPCASCGRRPSNAHHVVQKSAPWFGDDVAGNLLLLCGSGTARCHGAFHGNPYVDDAGRRWEQAAVASAIGCYVCKDRPDVLVYVLAKLPAPLEFLLRTYNVTTEALDEARQRHGI